MLDSVRSPSRTDAAPSRLMRMPKVLLVDDDELIMERLKLPLLKAGYEVFTATNGAAALLALQQHFMSIAILDRNMPDMNGTALCRAIRQQTLQGYVYIIMLTAHDATADVLVGLGAGADEYLSKSVSDIELVARLGTATRILSLEHALKIALRDGRRMTLTDPLTGAHNQNYLMRHLGAELKRARRFRADLSLLTLDIDHFKAINDDYGTAAGDVILQKFVKRIRKYLPRDYDWCARLTGDRFCVVLPQTDLNGARVVAERLRKAMEELPLRIHAVVRSITVSIGISGLQAMPTRESTTAETLLADADRYLQRSKEGGRNRVTGPVRDA